MHSLRILLLTVVFLLPTVVGPGAQAQEEGGGDYVVLTSIINRPLAPPVTAYVDIEMEGNTALYYQGGASQADFNGSTAMGPGGLMTAPGVATKYNLSAQFSLYPSGTEYYCGTLYYIDQLGYGGVAQIDSYQSGTVNAAGTSGLLTSQEIPLGTTWDEADAVAPEISNISPTNVVLGGGGSNGNNEVLIQGTRLTAGDTDMQPTITVTPPTGVASGAGLTVTFTSAPDDNSLYATYSVDTNPSSVGTYGVTVTTNAGTSNVVYVTERPDSYDHIDCDQRPAPDRFPGRDHGQLYDHGSLFRDESHAEYHGLRNHEQQLHNHRIQPHDDYGLDCCPFPGHCERSGNFPGVQWEQFHVVRKQFPHEQHRVCAC